MKYTVIIQNQGQTISEYQNLNAKDAQRVASIETKKPENKDNLVKVRIFKIECTKAYMMSEQGKGLSLYPWGENTEYYEGDDDGGTVYELPEGYTVSVTGANDLGIFDPQNCYCDLLQRGQKIALQRQNGEVVYLAESDDQDFENDVYEE